MSAPMNRRTFLAAAAATGGAACLGGALAPAARAATPNPLPDYRGPNVIIIRFGGGVRRRETVDADHTYAPYFRHILAKRGTLYTDMRIAEENGVQTGHGQGTLNILTGRYDLYKDATGRFLGERFEPKVPTLWEYLRKAHQIPDHQTLIINGEDRKQEEFFSFSNHEEYGINYRCATLSLYRFKCHLLRRQLAIGDMDEKQKLAKQKQLTELEKVDYRSLNRDGQGPQIEAFWERWREHYGDSGLVNPRGDRLLTELAIRAIRQLQPRLMMINYNDPDYVHWGYMSHYTRGIAIIDESIQRLVEVTDADPFYAGNTIFAIVPDCGRDDNRLIHVPCQHHFNSAHSRKIFAMLVGPGIEKDTVVDRSVEQIAMAPTLGRLMGLATSHTQGDVLGEALA